MPVQRSSGLVDRNYSECVFVMSNCYTYIHVYRENFVDQLSSRLSFISFTRRSRLIRRSHGITVITIKTLSIALAVA